VSRSRLGFLVAALITLGWLAGCTSSQAGEPKPGDTTRTTGGDETTSASSVPPSVDIPSPPRDLSLDGLDPCTLLTDAQKADLKINNTIAGVGESEIYESMKDCAFESDAAEPFVTYSMVAVTDVDVSFWISENRNADSELISIDGYPAAKFHTKGVQGSDCAIAIGVAKNQHLHVEMEPLSEDLQQEQICQGSERAAEMALQTLQTLK
jgi:uncharacterized protein DUF3558